MKPSNLSSLQRSQSSVEGLGFEAIEPVCEGRHALCMVRPVVQRVLELGSLPLKPVGNQYLGLAGVPDSDDKCVPLA